jgi:hypothetical protein
LQPSQTDHFESATARGSVQDQWFEVETKRGKLNNTQKGSKSNEAILAGIGSEYKVLLYISKPILGEEVLYQTK